ncbi:MAG: hypothetical protein OXC57_10790 [Rhodobacteraceae bacterium]|nr:hypothetical protein [Paracoccaceae bacterium]
MNACNFGDEAHPEQLYAAVYEKEEGQTNFKLTVRQLVDADKTVGGGRVTGTPYSRMR